MKIHPWSGIAALLLSMPAAAADYHVRDGDAAGLAGAIRHANASPGPDRVVLSSGGVYLVPDAADEAPALPVVTDTLRIDGHGAQIRRLADARLVLLSVAPGVRLELVDLSLGQVQLPALAD